MWKYILPAVFVGIPLLLLLVLILRNPLDGSGSSQAYYEAMKDPPAEAMAWSTGGASFSWSSTLEENSRFGPLKIFYRTFGSRKHPAIVMVHGFPTSSYDFREIIDNLDKDYFILVMDTPGYGFSDKPKNGFKYSLFDDARLVDILIREELKLDRFTLVTHDKGDSVGFALLQLLQSETSSEDSIDHHVILNGGIYLPLAELSFGQTLMESPVIGPLVTRLLSPGKFTKRFSELYSPVLTSGQMNNLASIFGYQGGVSVLPQTIKYLDQRREHEVAWLEVLAKSTIPATLIWGEKDAIAVPAISDYVWENYLRNRPSPATYWRIPCAGHYPQNDQPAIIAQLIRHALGDKAELDLSESGCLPNQVE